MHLNSSINSKRAIEGRVHYLVAFSVTSTDIVILTDNTCKLLHLYDEPRLITNQTFCESIACTNIQAIYRSSAFWMSLRSRTIHVINVTIPPQQKCEREPLNSVSLLPAVQSFAASFLFFFFFSKSSMTANTNGLISRCTTPPASLTINAMVLINYLSMSSFLAEKGLVQKGYWILWAPCQTQLTEQFMQNEYDHSTHY